LKVIAFASSQLRFQSRTAPRFDRIDSLVTQSPAVERLRPRFLQTKESKRT
jgi:hypothetical protein